MEVFPQLFDAFYGSFKAACQFFDRRAVHIDRDTNFFVFSQFLGLGDISVQALQSLGGIRTDNHRPLAHGGAVDLLLIRFIVVAEKRGIIQNTAEPDINFISEIKIYILKSGKPSLDGLTAFKYRLISISIDAKNTKILCSHLCFAPMRP